MAAESDAIQLITAMSEFLSQQEELSFNYDFMLEVVTTDAQKLAIASSGSIAMERPGNIHATRHGGFATVEVTFDGNTFSLLNADANAFAQIPFTGTVDSLITTLRDTYGSHLPGADLLSSDVAAHLLADVTDVKDLGSGVIRGVECDHLAFRAPEVDWQIWIAQGDAPYPCRYIITTTDGPQAPQYTLDLYGWGEGQASADFALSPPEGVEVMDIKSVPHFDSLSGIYMIDQEK